MSPLLPSICEELNQHHKESLGRGESAWHKAERSLIIWSWIAVSIFGFFQAMAGRFYMNPDGISYADLADAYLRGDWQSTISAHWSPLYPFLISLLFRLFHPSPYFESTAIHLLNFFFYLACFASLLFLICEIAALRSLQTWSGDNVRFPRSALLVLGTVIFLIATQHFLPLSLVTPDLCTAMFALLATTMILRIERLGSSYRRLASFGVILALGYLAKSVFFPLAFVFIAAALFKKANYRILLVRSAIVLLTFVVVAGPNIFALSRIKHSLIFSDTPSLNYIWWIDGVSFTHLQGGSAEGAPIHPTRKICDHPSVYEFATPIKGSYPVWFNPSYWYEGIRPKFHLDPQLIAIRTGWYSYKATLSPLNYFFWITLLLLLVQVWSGFSFRNQLRECWRMITPSLAALALFWPVHVEGRYVSAFIVIFCLGIWSSIRLPALEISRHILSAAMIIILVTTSLDLYQELNLNLHLSFEPMNHSNWDIARGLHEDFGLRDNDAVGCIGNCFASYWARMGNLRIVTEIPNREASAFRNSSPSVQAAALNAMSTAGAKAVVTNTNPGNGWRRIGTTDYFAYDLRH
jgi:hypothetical protein